MVSPWKTSKFYPQNPWQRSGRSAPSDRLASAYLLDGPLSPDGQGLTRPALRRSGHNRDCRPIRFELASARCRPPSLLATRHSHTELAKPASETDQTPVKLLPKLHRPDQ